MSVEAYKEKALQSADEFSSSPYPAWLFGGALLSKGLFVSKPLSEMGGTSGGSFHLQRTIAASKPTRASSLFFGVAHLLGGYIIFDGDVSNGTGFNFAWSTLYLIVNGRASFKSLLFGRVSPIGLGLLALGNATIYGKKFFWP